MTETIGEAAQLPIWIEYVSALAPVFAVVAATSAVVIAYINYLRQRKADKEAKFWRRLEWAIMMTSSDDLVDANMGMSVLNTMTRDTMFEADDVGLLKELNEEVRSKVIRRAYSGAEVEHDGGDP